MKARLLIQAAMLLAVPAGAAQASLTVSVFNGVTNSAQFNSSSAGGPISLSVADSAADGRAITGSAMVDYGIAKAVSTATGSNFGQIASSARAFWSDTITTPDSGTVPEPAFWAMLIAGFGLVGAMQRGRKLVVAA